jgi:hypothetical protein
MNIFGFDTVQAVLGLFTFLAGGIFFGFMLTFIKFIMFGFTQYSWKGKEVKNI